MKKLALALLLVFPISILPSVSAAPVKPGTACPIQGSRKVVGGMKYTCIKSGKKFVWSKGVATKVAAPTSSPTPSPSTSKNPSPTSSPSPTESTKSEIVILSKDPRITSASSLSKLELCQTTDQTPSFSMNQATMTNGFPRPKGSAYKAKSAKILFIPLSFTDRPFSKLSSDSTRPLSDVDLAKSAMRSVELTYNELSAGRFQLKTEMLPESQWWNINIPDSIKGGWGINNMDEIGRIINEYKPQFEFNEYDTYFFITSNIGGTGVSAQAQFGSKVKNSRSGYANLALMTRLTDQLTFSHELGHSLFAFEDLYLFNSSPSGVRQEKSTPDLWDLMAGNRPALLNWNRLLMGWLDEPEVRCLTSEPKSTHYLGPFDDNSEAKLMIINVSDGVTLAAEVRDIAATKGLLVYTINTYVSHGEGPIQTYDMLMTKGMKRNIYGWEISILENDPKGVLFEVTKTDVDKFVPPEKKNNNTGTRPESPIPLAGGELIRTSSTTAEIRWQPSNYESYRVYVTATNDFQKVFFETGFVNSNANPLNVPIKGLVCGIDLRVITQFFTKQNGQGDSRVEEKTLSRSSC